ncbi:MAG: PH domain-containing protein [Betaproteobacteria bacterium]|nr:PH domain-containing protein [Betaproteobacteria bacterium]MDH5221117.1 PH domain-containing protein [Betaproteobacteria bacterium]MDH5350253.1 PH domain-containing protein [Betaproteobacteria bacterium]
MSYIDESLSAGEKVEGLFRLHWTAWLWVWLWVLLAIPTLGLTLFVALYVYLQLKYQERGVTNKRVILKKGIIGRKTEEMKLTSIETVEIEQGVFGRLLGFGTVKITGRGVSDFLFTGIDDPMAVKRTIESIGNPIE